MNNLLHMFKHKDAHSGAVRALRLVNPFREWLIGLTVAITIVIGGGAYAFTIFLDGYTDEPREATATSENVRYDAKKVEDVLETYKQRKAEAELFESVTAGLPPAVVDEEDASGEETESGAIPVAQRPDMQVE